MASMMPRRLSISVSKTLHHLCQRYFWNNIGIDVRESISFALCIVAAPYRILGFRIIGRLDTAYMEILHPEYFLIQLLYMLTQF